MITLGDFIIKFLVSKKIDRVFLITGGAIAFVVDAFSRTKKIKYTCVAHEQAAAMMADAYYRVSKKLSVTMVTSGPGAQNLITGIACSWFDSIPSIHISGQVNSTELSSYSKNTKNVRQIGFQETDIVSIVKPITKFAYQLKNCNEIRFVLEKAFYEATSGRPGPVLVDIPMDIQKKLIEPKKLKKFVFKRILKKKNYSKIIANLLQLSKRPVIILGGGIKNSNSEKIL
jgi:acetolactate synthase-1/2/3 large subunit